MTAGWLGSAVPVLSTWQLSLGTTCFTVAAPSAVVWRLIYVVSMCACLPDRAHPPQTLRARYSLHISKLLVLCCHCGCVQLFGDSVDAHLAQQWCILLQQPLMFTPTGLKGSVAAFAAAVKAKASGSSNANDTAAAGGADVSGGGAADDTEGCCKDRDVFYYCKPRDPKAADRISIGMFHLPGVHLDGPFHTGMLALETGHSSCVCWLGQDTWGALCGSRASGLLLLLYCSQVQGI